MSVVDPFYTSKNSVQTSLHELSMLFDTWKDMLSDGKEYTEPFERTKAGLASGLADLEEEISALQKTIVKVENKAELRKKFLIDDAEIANRKKFIADVRSKCDTIKKALSTHQNSASPAISGSNPRGSSSINVYNSNSGNNSSNSNSNNNNSSSGSNPFGDTGKERRALFGSRDTGDRYTKLEDSVVKDNDAFIRDEQSRQQMIMREQEDSVEQIGAGVKKLQSIALEVGNELDMQKRILDDIDEKTDKVGGKMGFLGIKMDKLINNKDRGKICAIFILMIILVIVAVFVFYTPGNKKKEDKNNN